jgi:hypothetical protein
MKAGFLIGNDDGEYLSYYDRTEFGESYGWVLHPSQAMMFENLENAKRAIKYIDYHSHLYAVELIETDSKWIVRMPQAQRSGSQPLKSGKSQNRKNQTPFR